MMIPKPKNYCRCGCGQEIAATKKWVSGHNLKRRPKNAIVKNGRLHKETKCTECGRKFIKRADQINRRSLINLCSKQCVINYQSRTRKGKMLERKGEYRNCVKCGNEFYITPNRIKSNPKYCSMKCYQKVQREEGVVPKKFISSTNNKGKNNGMYKHGRRTGSHINKRKLRERVIERDGGNWCLLCGNPAPGLHLHRIIYGSQGGKYELDNCVQLCPEHHGEVHSNKKKWEPILLDHIKNGTLYNGGID